MIPAQHAKNDNPIHSIKSFHDTHRRAKMATGKRTYISVTERQGSTTCSDDTTQQEQLFLLIFYQLRTVASSVWHSNCQVRFRLAALTNYVSHLFGTCNG